MSPKHRPGQVPSASVINSSYRFSVSREKEGEFGRPGAVLRAAPCSSVAAIAPPPGSRGRNLPSSANILSLDRVLTALGQESWGKKQNKTKLPKTKTTPSPSSRAWGRVHQPRDGSEARANQMRPPPQRLCLGLPGTRPCPEIP